MNKLYNEKNVIANELLIFLTNLGFHFTKPQLKTLPYLISSIILSENITTADISKIFIDDSLLTNDSSIQKKLWRFFNNSKFDGIAFYNASINILLIIRNPYVITS